MKKKNILNIEQEVASSKLGDLDVDGLPIIENNKGKSREGLRPGFTRVTFILKDKHLEIIKKLSKAQQRTILDIMNEALESYLSGKKSIKIPTKKIK
jgi:hypothetical protein